MIEDPDQNSSSTPPESSPESTIPKDDSKTHEKPVADVSMTPVEDEPLPEWVELTPELFEDECVRGDFMLRWAAILLAVLFGCCYITETPVLVQVKSGQFVTSNGFLPPRTDPFAIATEGQSWTNLHWMADVVLGTVESIGGFQALSILTAFKLGVCFWFLSQITYKNVSTWWASICAVLAVIAVFPAVQPGESSVTILGFSLLLYLLHRWRETPDSSVLWGLPVLFIFWANMDTRVWVGLLFLLIVMVVHAVKRTATKRQFTIGAAALIGGVLLSPWPVQPVLGFQSTIANATQAQLEGLSGELFPRYAFSMMSPEFWVSPDIFPIAAAVLLGLSFICLFLNAARFDWSLTFAWMVINGLSFYFGELVPYAAIINCIVATLQGQDWYRNKFKNDFEIKGTSVFIARAGRAVTVVSFFLVAYATINGALMGPQGRRIGLGLDPRLKNRLESTEQDLVKGAYEGRVFNVRADQGDMLIWLDLKPYLDSRNGLFANGQTDFTEVHRQIRASLFAPVSPEGVAEATKQNAVSWQDEFAKSKIHSLVLRLWGEAPAYSPFMKLVGTRAWPMTGFGASGAIFTRGDLDDPKVIAFIEENIASQFVEQAYRLDEKSKVVTETGPLWPRATSEYDKWLIQKLKVMSNDIQLARHYIAIAQRLQTTLALEQGMAISQLAIRGASEGLFKTPDDPHAYRVMIDAQGFLQDAEQRFLSLYGVNYPIQFRVQQAICHAFHAAKASGNARDDMKRLFFILLNQQSLDTAEAVAEKYSELYGQLIVASEGQDEAVIEQGKQILEQIETAVADVKKQVAEAREKSVAIPQLAAMALQNRCPAMALSILEEDKTVVASNPGLQLMHATLLLRNGRTEEAWEELEGLESLVSQSGAQNAPFVSQWRTTTALANAVANQRPRAAELFGEQALTLNEQNLRSIIHQPPGFAEAYPVIDIWSGLSLMTHFSALRDFPERWAILKLQQALVRIDQGNLQAAKDVLQTIYDVHPEFSMRSLVVLYLSLITGEEYELEPPSQKIPIWDGMFVPDEEEASAIEQNMPPKQPGKDPAPEKQPAPEMKSETNNKQDTKKNLPPTPALPERADSNN